MVKVTGFNVLDNQTPGALELIGVRGHLERRINQVQNPGIKSNYKMVIFNNHLAPIYYMCENMWLVLSGHRVCRDNKNRSIIKG